MISYLIGLCSAFLLSSGCAEISAQPEGSNPKPEEKVESFRWDFDNVEGWAYTHQDTASVKQWSIENGSLYLRTRAYTRDRSKMFTLKNDFQTGTYTWRIYVPNFHPYEQASIGAFIYQDDEHEIDFEIGYGTAKTREEYGAEPGQMMVCMTNQGHPFSSSYVPVSPGWHTFSIILEESKGAYVAKWLVDGQQYQKLPLDFGPEDAKFRCFCSMENLLFIGDKIPEHDNYGRFDYVTFEGKTSGDYVEEYNNVTEKYFTVTGDFPVETASRANVFHEGKMSEFTWNQSNQKLEGFISEGEEYWGLHPFDPSAVMEGNTITTVFPIELQAVDDESDIAMVSVASNNADNLEFRNITSGIKFMLGENYNGINKIVLRSEDKIAGNLKIDILSHQVEAESNEITILPAKGKFFQPEQVYMIPLIPGNHSGLTFSFEGLRDYSDYGISEVQVIKGEIKDIGLLTKEEEWQETRWDFTDGIEGWYYFTHTPNASKQCYSVEDGIVKIWTDANTMDRNKLHTYDKSFGEGIYTFRTYVSKIAAGEKCSIGAFIYADDKHELDFEIGYGTKAARESCNAKEDEMVACMTSQAFPFSSTYTPISVGWHTLVLEMTVVNGNYVAKWYIDDIYKKTLNLQFGPETTFLISISVENLHFMGDFQPTHTNYGLFDYVSYKRPIH